MVTETTTTTSSSVTTSSSSSASSSLPLSTVESSTTTTSSSSSSPIPLKRKIIFCILAVLPILLISADSFMGLPWTVTLVGCLLMVTDGDEPDYVLQRVDAQLLLFFSALFVCVAGFDETGIPALVWKAAANAGVGVGSLSGAFSFMLLVVIGSNTVSNVPLVLLMAQSVSTGLDVRLTWLMLAFISTVAGNLTLMGSVANLIVAEKCKDTHYPLTFLEHLKVGVPSTLLVCLIGVPLVWVCAK
jgi:Na+/H+ antiporter NhaD/arsenite permease-like protein